MAYRPSPTISSPGHSCLTDYATALRAGDDLTPKTIANYLSDLRQFIGWCEQTWQEGIEASSAFTPAAVTTPTLTQYRAFLQTVRQLRPATINRSLISLKRYFQWAVQEGLMARDPARAVKLLPETPRPPRHLSDREEEALLAALDDAPLCDRTMVILLLHTGLRAQELCNLQRQHVKLGKRSGVLQIYGKRNKYREVSLNATARSALTAYLSTLPVAMSYLFPSERTGGALTVRGLEYRFSTHVRKAGLDNVRLHDLRHRFGYRMAATVPIHRLAQIMGHDSLDTTLLYIQGTPQDLQQAVETIAWQ
jgi:integrase/recombinase XerC